MFQKHWRTFSRFFFINVLALIADIFLFMLCTDFLKTPLNIAVAVGVGSGAVVAYVGHSLVTFGNRDALLGEKRAVAYTFGRYVLIIAVVYAVRLLITSALSPYISITLVGYCVAVGVSFLVNYVLSYKLFHRRVPTEG
ncbi:MAG: GtrA family protein [Alphaproteobacteria bacterium]|nr:GtrA family protein [Alphaproteobacteria bacterium]